MVPNAALYRDADLAYRLSADILPLVDDKTAIVPGYNIALAALGGKVERVTSDSPGNYGDAENLNDGAAVYWKWGFQGIPRCDSCGWSSRQRAAFPHELVFSFFKQREAIISSVIIDTTTKGTLRYPDQIPQRVEIWTSSVSPTEGFTRIATARLEKATGEQSIRFPPTRARYVQIRLLTNYGDRLYTRLGEVKIIEAATGAESILRDFEKDLALPELGGVLARFSSQRSKDSPAAELLSAMGSKRGSWLSADDRLPQDFLFAFRGDREALIDRIALNPVIEQEANTRVKTISLSVSTANNPLEGFREIGQFELDRAAREQVFPVGARARFVRLRVLENFGGRKLSLGKVRVLEGRAPEYQSILVEGYEAASPAEETVTPSQIDDSRFPSEREPNDTLAQANRLELDRFTRGAINPLGEVDYFRVPAPARERRVLTLELMGRPNIRAAVSLLDAEGRELRQFDPGRVPADHTTFSWLLEQSNPLVRLTEPPVSVVVIWDTSGSMEGSTEELQQAVEAFIDQIRPDDRLNLIRFSDDVEVLLGGFSGDNGRLKSASRGKFTAKGGTTLYEAIAKGMELLKGVRGNRAIVLMTDGTNTAGELDHPAFWNLLEEGRVRIYAIGMGVGQQMFTPELASSGERILGHIAMATNGLALIAPTKSALKSRYQEIADELHQTARYYLKPVVSKGSGFLSVATRGEAIATRFFPRFELILDASGSMRERKRKIEGRLKIDVAKDVMADIIKKLPDGSEAALRFYGHRIREGRRGDCKDSQLIVPFGRIDSRRRSAMLDRVREIRALGTTPLVYSLEQAAKDFPSGQEKKHIILVTDGKEECGGDPAGAAQRLMREGFNVKVDVVGFKLADEKTKQDMRRVAEITKGRFYDAQDTEGLRRSIQDSLAVPYDVVDAGDVEVASGLTGRGSIELPEGIYRVIVRTAEEPIRVPDVRIAHERSTKVELQKVGRKINTRIFGPDQESQPIERGVER